MPTNQTPLKPNKELAYSIAEKIFTNGFGEKATQLKMMNEHGHYLGGWGLQSVADLIEKAINAWDRRVANE